MAKILDGNLVSEKIYAEILKEVEKLGAKPGLAAILVGNDFASRQYVKIKQRVCEKLGFYSETHHFREGCAESEIIEKIQELNTNPKIDGILVQLPLPQKFNQNNVLEAIKPEKDVEGMTPLNAGLLALGIENFVPCTPLGIIKLLEHYKIPLEGKNITIINHSNVIGKPLALMLLNRNATVTVCHIRTKNLKQQTLTADIIISATGVHKLITQDMIQSGAVVVDAGISKAEGKIAGDVDFDNVKKKASYISRVPGGVGPMTVACLMLNTIRATKEIKKSKEKKIK